jgi:hypothetical protein
LLNEAGSILDRLVLTASAKVVRRLCSRFNIIQEHFVMEYAEARACAVSALRHAEAFFSFHAKGSLKNPT